MAKEDMRASTPDDRLALKAAVRRAAKLAGGAASVQHMTRASEHDLSKYASAEHADRHCPIDVAIELDREAGAPVILAAMARLVGYRLVALEREGDDAIDMRDLARLSVDTSRVIEDVSRALEDGEIDEAEDRQINIDIETAVRDLRALQDKSHKMRARSRAAASEEKRP